MAATEWRKVGKHLIGYHDWMECYHIRPRWFFKGYKVSWLRGHLSGVADVAFFDTVDECVAWTEDHQRRWHAAADAKVGEPWCRDRAL